MDSKIKTADEAVKVIKDGDTIMIGGFGQSGYPLELVAALNKLDVKDLSIISCNTGSETMPEMLELMGSDKIKKVYCSYPRNNPNTVRRILSGEIEADIMPMGTYIERIRSGGAGLGGVFTPAGIDADYEKDHIIKEFDGKRYMLITPLKADVALVKARTADEWGNLFMRALAKNFNTSMATAAEYVIAEVEEICKVGELDAEKVHVPAPYVDAIVKGGE